VTKDQAVAHLKGLSELAERLAAACVSPAGRKTFLLATDVYQEALRVVEQISVPNPTSLPATELVERLNKLRESVKLDKEQQSTHTQVYRTGFRAGVWDCMEIIQNLYVRPEDQP
jgi:hypothetical protein